MYFSKLFMLCVTLRLWFKQITSFLERYFLKVLLERLLVDTWSGVKKLEYKLLKQNFITLFYLEFLFNPVNK